MDINVEAEMLRVFGLQQNINIHNFFLSCFQVNL